MKNLNIVVISGGSGNDSLIKGIKEIYKDSNVKVIVNAYDNGKSTGICRNVTDTLGVSDIRKNHIRMYKALTQTPDERLVEFYTSRYNLGEVDDAIIEARNHLKKWGLESLYKYVKSFFAQENATRFKYNDFNIANIVYAEMYREYGYEYTNKFFCDLLGIDNFVVLNSHKNIYIEAETEQGNILNDEGLIVEHCNKQDKIVKLHYFENDKEYGYSEQWLYQSQDWLNPEAISLVENADLIVISTGTFWSSIYPTLEYGDFYKIINNSRAKKIWAINNTEDKDAYGVSSNDFIDIVEKLGLDLTKFVILENKDSIKSLHMKNDKYDVRYASMENNDGKHNGHKFAKEILKIYFGIDKCRSYDTILFDFDDTIWSRLSEFSDELKVSYENIELLNKVKAKRNASVQIVSGNSYSSIQLKLYRALGTNLDNFNVKIWADANAILYSNNKKIDKINELMINNEDVIRIITILNVRYGLSTTQGDVRVHVNDDDVTYIKIKPLQHLERELLVDVLNNQIFKELNIDYLEARKTGYTTIDIVTKTNTKVAVFNHLNLENKKVLYIGDEFDNGNDSEIAKVCTHAISTSGAKETNILIKLLLED